MEGRGLEDLRNALNRHRGVATYPAKNKAVYILYIRGGHTKHVVAAAAAAIPLLFQEFVQPTPSIDSSVVPLVLERTYDVSPCFGWAAWDVKHLLHMVFPLFPNYAGLPKNYF